MAIHLLTGFSVLILSTEHLEGHPACKTPHNNLHIFCEDLHNQWLPWKQVKQIQRETNVNTSFRLLSLVHMHAGISCSLVAHQHQIELCKTSNNHITTINSTTQQYKSG